MSLPFAGSYTLCGVRLWRPVPSAGRSFGGGSGAFFLGGIADEARLEAARRPGRVAAHTHDHG
eukprot:6495704-Prymnesium_polylepis.1